MKPILCWLCLLPACTRTTELIGDLPGAPYCPTSIDVFGGKNVSLIGCGGPRQAPMPPEDGMFAPGTADYDGSVAGRIYARILDDPELLGRFGRAWTVRSCSAPAGMLTQMTPSLVEDDCGQDSPSEASALLGICGDNPAPVMLLAAGMLDDRCHGGGPDSSKPDDRATYARHMAERLDAFVDERRPQVALVGATTEWTATPVPGLAQAAACGWTRPDWEVAAVAEWRQARQGRPTVYEVADLHDEFRRHSDCCGLLGVPCEASHSTELGVINCDGAEAIVELWYQALRSLLLGNQYTCRAGAD